MYQHCYEIVWISDIRTLATIVWSYLCFKMIRMWTVENTYNVAKFKIFQTCLQRFNYFADEGITIDGEDFVDAAGNATAGTKKGFSGKSLSNRNCNKFNGLFLIRWMLIVVVLLSLHVIIHDVSAIAASKAVFSRGKKIYQSIGKGRKKSVSNDGRWHGELWMLTCMWKHLLYTSPKTTYFDCVKCHKDKSLVVIWKYAILFFLFIADEASSSLPKSVSTGFMSKLRRKSVPNMKKSHTESGEWTW